MTPYEEVALALFNEHRAQTRHHEDQREKLTTIILLMAGGLLAFSTTQSQLELRHLYLTVPAILLGVFGAVASLKHYQLNRMHAWMAEEFRTKLQEATGLPIADLQGAGYDRSVKSFGPVASLHLYHLWLVIPTSVALAGGILTFLIIRDRCS